MTFRAGRTVSAVALSLVAAAGLGAVARAPIAHADDADHEAADGDGTPPVVRSGAGVNHPSSRGGGVFLEAPHGFEVSQAHNDELKHHWPASATTGGAQLDVDGNTGSSGASPSLFPGPGQNGWIPYDAAVAVGPGHVLALVNDEWIAYDRNGTQLAAHGFGAWWGLSAGSAFDPKCFYDAAAGRFVMIATSMASPAANMYVSVSQTSDPTGSWWTWTMDWRYDGRKLTQNWGDFPGLGYDDAAVYVTANQYAFTGGFKYAKVRVLKKSQLYAGAASLTFTDFTNLKNADGSTVFTAKPARCLSASTNGWLLNTRSGGGSSVSLWRVDSPSATPKLVRVANVAVGTYADPPDAQQAGSNVLVATGDCRTQEVVYRDGAVFTALTEKTVVSSTNQAAVRFIKIGGAGNLIKDSTYRSSIAGVSYYYPAVTVDAAGDVVMVFNRSSPAEYISMDAVVMPVATGTFGDSTVLVSGTTWLSLNRWGDYNAIQIDDAAHGAWLMAGDGRDHAFATDIVFVSVP